MLVVVPVVAILLAREDVIVLVVNLVLILVLESVYQVV